MATTSLSQGPGEDEHDLRIYSPKESQNGNESESRTSGLEQTKWISQKFTSSRHRSWIKDKVNKNKDPHADLGDSLPHPANVI